MELSSDLYQHIHTCEFTVTQSETEQHLVQHQKLVFHHVMFHTVFAHIHESEISFHEFLCSADESRPGLE